MDSTRKEHSGPVLVPVDFSTESRAALDWAVEYSQLIDAPLLLLHVVHDPSDAPGLYRDDQADETGDGALISIEEAAAKMLTKFVERFRRRHPGSLEGAEVRLIAGIPGTRILEVADEVDARAIAMGSRGRTGITRILLGSTAENVVRKSVVPVIIIKDERKKARKPKKKDKKKDKKKQKGDKDKKRKSKKRDKGKKSD